MSFDPVELPRQLIQIPSVNPTVSDANGPHVGEGRLTDFLQAQVDRLGLPWQQLTVKS